MLRNTVPDTIAIDLSEMLPKISDMITKRSR